MRIAVVVLAVALVLALLYPERVIGLKKQFGAKPTVTAADTATRAVASTAKGAGKKIERSRESTALAKTQQLTAPLIMPSDTNGAVVPGNLDIGRPRATVGTDLSRSNDSASSAGAVDAVTVIERARDLGARGTVPHLLAAVAAVAQDYGAVRDMKTNRIGSLNWLKNALAAAQKSSGFSFLLEREINIPAAMVTTELYLLPAVGVPASDAYRKQTEDAYSRLARQDRGR